VALTLVVLEVIVIIIHFIRVLMISFGQGLGCILSSHNFLLEIWQTHYFIRRENMRGENDAALQCAYSRYLCNESMINIFLSLLSPRGCDHYEVLATASGDRHIAGYSNKGSHKSVQQRERMEEYWKDEKRGDIFHSFLHSFLHSYLPK
jgi:hypothetical protein